MILRWRLIILLWFVNELRSGLEKWVCYRTFWSSRDSKARPIQGLLFYRVRLGPNKWLRGSAARHNGPAQFGPGRPNFITSEYLPTKNELSAFRPSSSFVRVGLGWANQSLIWSGPARPDGLTSQAGPGPGAGPAHLTPYICAPCIFLFPHLYLPLKST